MKLLHFLLFFTSLSCQEKPRWMSEASKDSGFNWFQDSKFPKLPPLSPVQLDRSPPEIPIPPMPVEDRYPYRYSSAQPSQYEKLGEQKKLQTCLNIMREGKRETVRRINLRNVVQLEGYETTSMTSSLQPFQPYKEAGVKKCHLPKSILYPTFGRFEIQDEFDEYIVDQLYPGWQRNPKYKRRLVYKLEPLKKHR